MKIRYYSHAGLQTGYGRAATELALALAQHPQIELELVTIPTSTAPPLDERGIRFLPYLRHTPSCPHDGPKADPNPDIIIIHTLPGDCARLGSKEDLWHPDRCHIPVVAYTTWEGFTAAPAIKEPLRRFAQVWLPSEAARHPLTVGAAPLAYERTRILPHAFDPALVVPRRRAELDDSFRFYYVGAWTPRKNPEGLLRAFLHAFRKDDPVELILRSTVSLEDSMIALASSALEQSELPTVSFLRDPLTEAELWQLHADADCFVTASRGEAWDLGAFEAMLARRHIITPALGSMEFLGRERTSATILGPIDQRAMPCFARVQSDACYSPYKPPPAPPIGYQMTVTTPTGMTGHDLWLEPDLARLSELMYRAFSLRQRELRVDYDPAQHFSRSAVANTAVTYLENLIAQGDPPCPT